MERVPIEVTRQDRIYCLKASSDYHSEVCEECKFYPNCDHMIQDDLTELTIKDLEALEKEPCEDAVSRTLVLDAVDKWIKCGEWYYSNATDYLFKRMKMLPSVNPTRERGEKALDEIIAYMQDDTITWRDISDDIICDILIKHGFMKGGEDAK